MLTAMMFGKSLTRFSLPMAFFLVFASNGFAQAIGGNSFLNKLNSAYVKSLDEFISRFNMEEFHPDIYYEEDENLRTRSLLSLFDWHRFQIEDSNVAKQMISFVDTVCWNDIHLNLEDGGVYAEAQCLFEYNGREIPLNLVLVFENIRDDYFKWAVAGANGLIENKLLDTVRDGYINPVQHELHFSDLSYACSSGLTRHVAADKRINQFSFILGMMKTGRLKFVACNKVRFHFMQVPGFIFIVDKMNRLDFNSGYLIVNLINANEQEKKNYIKLTLGI